MKPNKEKIEAFQQIKPSTSSKELKSFLGAIQNMAKFLIRLSEKTDRIGVVKEEKRLQMDQKRKITENDNRNTMSSTLH